MKRILVIVAAIAVASVVGGLIVRGEYATRQSAERQFTIAEDFTTVRKILVRKNAAKQIVTMGGDSEFIEQEWEEVGVDPGGEKIGEGMVLNLIAGEGDWRLGLNGNLKVRTLDEYVGQEVILLKQRVQITPDLVDSRVELDVGTERLNAYEMTTRFSRTENDQTLVELSLEQEILTDAPWFAHRIADRRVRASVEKTLVNQDAAIRKVIEENKDDVGLFPLR